TNLSSHGRRPAAELRARHRAAHGATLLPLLAMRIIRKHLRDAHLAPSLINNAPKAILAYSLRCRSRQRIKLDNGEVVGLILNQGTVLRHGDILVADDGKLIAVHAAIEPVVRVGARNPLQLTRAAYHLGNRHI